MPPRTTGKVTPELLLPQFPLSGHVIQPAPGIVILPVIVPPASGNFVLSLALPLVILFKLYVVAAVPDIFIYQFGASSVELAKEPPPNVTIGLE